MVHAGPKGTSLKIILTGATGFVGGEVLTRWTDNPQVEQVTCLTRRALGVVSPKVRTVLQEDFTSYDRVRLDDLADHAACIWALGGKASDLGSPAQFACITHGFTLALASGVAAKAARPLHVLLFERHGRRSIGNRPPALGKADPASQGAHRKGSGPTGGRV
jgi:uncharacterized protein YbjT (DUF2867 family)